MSDTKTELTQEAEQIEEVLELAQKTKIRDEQDYLAVAALLREGKRRAIELETLCDAMVSDAKKIIDRTRSWFTPALEKYAAIESAYKSAIVEYCERLDKQAWELRLEAAKTGDKTALVKASEFVPPKTGGMTIASTKKLVINDESKIPERFWKRAIDTKALQAAIADGEKIDGAEIVIQRQVRVSAGEA